MNDIKNSFAQRKASLDENPKGIELKVLAQRDREKCGRYYAIPEDKTNTMIFVRDGEDAKKKIAAFMERVKNRTKMWN